METGPQLERSPWPFLQGSEAVQRVRGYFDPKGAFTGRWFEFLGDGGDRPEVAGRFTAEDIVAVSMLSVSIPPRASIEILDARAGTLNGLLEGVPVDVELSEASDEVIDAERSAAAKLWTELERIPGVGWVTAHKLLARKRPDLLPVYDRVVKAALQPTSREFWGPLRNTLRADDRAIVRRLQEIRKEANLDVQPSLLRILDVAVWMEFQS